MNKRIMMELILASSGVPATDNYELLRENGYLNDEEGLTLKAHRALRSAKRRIRKGREVAVQEIARKADAILRSSKEGATPKQVDAIWGRSHGRYLLEAQRNATASGQYRARQRRREQGR